MKLSYDGTFTANQTPEEVYQFLITPEKYAPLMPFFKELKDVEADNFTLIMEIGIPQMRGKAEVKVRRLPSESSDVLQAKYNASGKHALGMVDSVVSYTVTASGDATSDVKWQCDSVVSGTLASLAQGILAPLARRNIDQMVKSVQRALNGGAEPEVEKAGVWSRMSEGVKRFTTKGDRQ